LQRRMVVSPRKLSKVVLWALAMMLACRISAALPDATLPLWTGKAPLATGNAVTDLPAIDVYLPAKNPTQTGVLVIPGGGYHYLAAPEGEPVAKWLCAHGLAARLHHGLEVPGHQPRVLVPLAEQQRVPARLARVGLVRAHHLDHGEQVVANRDARELGERKAGELARRLEVRGLPHAAVHLANRPSAQVHILGQSRLVFASGLASPRRLSYVIAALIAAAIVVVLIVLVAHGG